MPSSLPTLVKTWVHSLNHTHVSSGTFNTDTGRSFFYCKEALKGIGWVTEGSSNGTSLGAMDAVDRWTTAAGTVQGGGNHTWWVGSITLGASGEKLYQLLSTPSSTYNRRKYATGNFTGGAVNADPNHTGLLILDENTNGVSTTTPNFSPFGAKVSGFASNDGQTGLYVAYLNTPANPHWWFAWGLLGNPAAGVDNSGMWIIDDHGPGTGNPAPVYGRLSDAARLRFIFNGTVKTAFLSTAGHNGILHGRAFGASGISGNYPILPMQAVSTDGLILDKVGNIIDLFAGATVVNEGTGYPITPTPLNQFYQVGDLVVPGDSATVLQTT